MGLAQDVKDLLNKYMGGIAYKVQLGDLISEADDVAPVEIDLNDGNFIVGNASNQGAGVAMSGDGTLANTGALTIAAGAVTEPKLGVPNADSLMAARVARATYDFNEHGGSIGDVQLGVTLPDNAIITRTWYEVLNTLTSATDAATIALKAEGAGDLKAAVAISDGADPWDAGRHDGIQDGAVANMVKTTDARVLVATIAVEAVTAGKFVVFAEYVVSD